jgi:CheY-like chemotaxis protein
MNAEAKPLVGLRLILVEENDLIRRTVAMTAAEFLGIRIAQAESVSEVPHLLRQQVFDGLVLSIPCSQELNKLKNLHFLKLIRRGEVGCKTDLPIIALVGDCTESCLESIKEAGIIQAIVKPFKTRALLKSLMEVFAIETLADQQIRPEEQANYSLSGS